MPRPKPPDAALLSSPDDTEAQFYEALQRGDIEKLMSVWSDDDEIACVHPGGPRLMGPAAIRSAFEAMFANGGVEAYPEKVRRITSQSNAVHSVVERIQVMTDEGARVAWVVATNVYVKSSLGWRLVAHHASPGSTTELPELNDAPSTLH